MGKKLDRVVISAILAVVRPFFRTKVKGLELIPEGGCLICPNHTTATDAVSTVIALYNHCEFAAMAKAELFKYPVISWLLRAAGGFPVNRESNDLNAIRLGTKALKEGKKLILFPEGTRRRDGNLGPAKAGAGMFALRAKVPIVPVYITPGKKFLRLTTVRFGEPFYPDCIGEKHSDQYQNAADQIMVKIAAMMREEKGE